MTNEIKESMLIGLLIQLIIIMFVAIYWKIDQLPNNIADCTLEIRPEEYK